MHRQIRPLSVVSLIASIVLAACTTSCFPQGVDDRRLREADRDTGNWLMYGRTYDEQRFSPLQQINENNVSRLCTGRLVPVVMAKRFAVRHGRGGSADGIIPV